MRQLRIVFCNINNARFILSEDRNLSRNPRYFPRIVYSFCHSDLHNIGVKIALVSLVEHKWIARVDDIGLKFKVAIEAGTNTRGDRGARSMHSAPHGSL